MTDTDLRHKVLTDAIARTEGCPWCGAREFPERSHYPDCDLLRALNTTVEAPQVSSELPSRSSSRGDFFGSRIPTNDPVEAYQPWRTVYDVLDAIVTEWDTDPTSVACFDLRLIARAKEILKARNDRLARRGLR